jgi:Redoxin
MQRLLLIFLALLSLGLTVPAQSVSLDSVALMNVDSHTVRLSGFRDKKALVLVFTGNHCVYSKKYEDRLINLARECASKGAAFVLVNSNAPDLSQDDRFALMQARAREKGYPCPDGRRDQESRGVYLSAQGRYLAARLFWQDRRQPLDGYPGRAAISA